MIFKAFAHNWAPAASLQATATLGRINGRRSLRPRYAIVARALAAAALLLSWHATAATAADLTWNTTTGDWNTTAANWLDGASSVAWSQTSNQAATNAAIFAGTDGTYTVTTSGTVNAQSVTFNNSGYTVTGAALILRPTSTTSGTITVAANKTATINAPITYSNNAAATNTINTGATLNLGGGATNSQYTFNGDGTVNITGGSYESNAGSINVPTMNITGGAYNYTPGASNGVNIGNGNIGARSVNVTVSTAGALTLNNATTNSTATAPFIAIGNNTTDAAYTASLTVQTGGTVTVANQGTRAGEIRINNNGTSNGLFDVQGGSVNVGIGSSNAANQIYLFKNGATTGYSSRFTQSGGTVQTRGIQFGGTTGTYDSGATASLELSGGELYVGAAGITKGSGAADLAPTITLTGGTLGAAATWASSMDMTLGTAGGGVTVRAANSSGTAADITLSGILGGSGSMVKTGLGTLTLSGNNTFNGLTINQGTVNVTTSSNALGAGSVTLGGAGSAGALLTVGRAYSNPITVNAPDSGSVVIGANGGGSGYTLSGGIVLNGNVTIRTFNNTISGSTIATGTLTGGITGTGAVLLNNNGLAANTLTFNTGPINHVGSLTLGATATATGDTTIDAVIGANVTSVTQNSATSMLVLGGVNAYTGPTNINFGTLKLGASGSIANSGSIVVASGATFDVSALTSGFTLGAAQTLNGAGTVSGSMTANGTLSPGLSGAVGTLSFLNNLSLGSGSILSYQLNGGDTTVGGAVNDLSTVSGNLSLDGTINVAESVANSFSSATVGNAWRLFNYTGTLTDNTLSLGTMPTLGSGLTFGIDTGTAGQVNLVIVPEPATIATGLIGLGLTGLAAARRRRIC